MSRVLERESKGVLTGAARRRKVGRVEKAAKPPALGTILEGHAPGTWVVLDAGMTRVLGAATSPDEALKKAGITSYGQGADEDESQPIIFRVPDQTVFSLY